MQKWVLLLFSFCFISISYARCPTGYHQEGNYCVASSANAKPATPLHGSHCPTGWHQEGNFCVASGSSAKQIVPLSGSHCPTGWHQEGKFCVSNR